MVPEGDRIKLEFFLLLTFINLRYLYTFGYVMYVTITTIKNFKDDSNDPIVK